MLHEKPALGLENLAAQRDSAAGGRSPLLDGDRRRGVALGKSRYLDGHQTEWSQQFWAMVWERGGGTILE